MLTDQRAPRESAGAGPWAHLLDRHRADWVASIAGERGVTELDGEPDAGEAFRRAARESTVVWLDDYASGGSRESVADALRSAAAEGRPLVVGVPADADGAASREADRLASELGGVTMAQRLAAGSLIAGKESDEGDVVHYLVCVNIEQARTAGRGAMTDAQAVPLLTGYVRYLEEANRSLSEANARLAREKLGVHDSAAGVVEPRIAELKEQLAEQREIARQARAALEAPRYRAVDRLRALAFSTPGVSKLFRLRSGLIQRRRGHG